MKEQKGFHVSVDGSMERGGTGAAAPVVPHSWVNGNQVLSSCPIGGTEQGSAAPRWPPQPQPLPLLCALIWKLAPVPGRLLHGLI